MFKTLSALSFLGVALAYMPATVGTASCWTFPPVSTNLKPSPSPIPNAQQVWAQCGAVPEGSTDKYVLEPIILLYVTDGSLPPIPNHEIDPVVSRRVGASASIIRMYGIEQLDCHAIFVLSPGFNGDGYVLDGGDNPDGYPNIRPSYPRCRAIGELSSSCDVNIHAPQSDHRHPDSTNNAEAKATRAKPCASPVHIAESITSGIRNASQSRQRQRARLNRHTQPSFAHNSILQGEELSVNPG
ncbi:hypothetical protein BDN71DRAFT_1508187 [Pleurotus eryngii]|uniref:Uncharacterized protein n=1 Tax=Pleurotus eryngii TaxID=5323 RepID=A0A9P6DEB1_PLEER|nr:hypothetical protein BDN71DRAFT_1508187 [Pleurotus eryngii]